MAKSRIGAPKIDGEKENGPRIGADEFEEDEGMGEWEEELKMEIGIDWKGKSSLLSEEMIRRRTKPGERFHPSRQCQIAFGPNYGQTNTHTFHIQMFHFLGLCQVHRPFILFNFLP